MRPGSVDRPELHNIVYDVLPARILDGRRGKARVFVLLIDESLLNILEPSFGELIEQLRQLPNAARPTDQIALMTFSECPSVANLRTQTTRLLPEFNPGLLLPTLSKSDFFIPASDSFAPMVELVKSLGHKEPSRPSALFGALKWAAALLEGLGGRLILFTSGRTTDPELNVLPLLLSKSISLSVFKQAGLPIAEMWSQMTGGVVSALANFPPLAALFSDDTTWSGSAVIRTNRPEVQTTVMGPCCNVDEGAVVLPAMGGGSSLIYELTAKDVKPGEFLFQIAIRYLDDANILKIRVINGKLPLAKKVVAPLDEAAIALFLSRKRVYEHNEIKFRAQVGFIKKFVGEDSLFPACAFAGSVRDPSFMVSVSVEKFVMSLSVTIVEIEGVPFRVRWAPDFTLIFPRLEDHQLEVMRAVGRNLGAGYSDFFFPDTEEEFQMMSVESREAARWFAEIPAK
jgi:hypothetical protein